MHAWTFNLFTSFYTMPAPTLNQHSIYLRVAGLAKRKWIAAGRPDGDDWFFWFAAEREICCLVAPPMLGFEDSPDGYFRINRDHPNKTWHLEWEEVQ